MNEVLPYNQFERLLATAQDLVKATGNIYDLMNMGNKIPEELYVNVIRLHNTAVDYIEAMKEYVKKED